MHPRTQALALLALFACLVTADAAKKTRLKAYAQFDSPHINESSGLVKSRTQPGVYWTHNDSGDFSRIFAISRNGELLKPHGTNNRYAGIPVTGARNIDWEDIANDNEGNLYIGAFGNNANNRKDLSIYILREPQLDKSHTAKSHKKIPFIFPDQKEFPPPPERMDFDVEALFHANGKLYILSKNRGNRRTKLYRLDSEHTQKTNTLTLMGEFNVQGVVTGADALSDGSKIAILTYSNVWVFEKPDDSDDYFSGPVSVKWIAAAQMEAICFDDEETLLITNEQKRLFEIKLSDLAPPVPPESS